MASKMTMEMLLETSHINESEINESANATEVLPRSLPNEESGNATDVLPRSLPNEIWGEVVANIASSSIPDLHNFKSCSKDFHHLSNERYVLQKVSFDNFPDMQWYPNAYALNFLKNCEESGNLEALFIEGILEYFKFPNGNSSGLEKLKIAAEGGHIPSKYAYGMILMSSDNNKSIQEGIEHMRSLRMSGCIMQARHKMQSATESLWKNNGMLVRNQSPVCKSKTTCTGWRLKQGAWLLVDDKDDDLSSCEHCRWDYELEFFYSLFNVQ